MILHRPHDFIDSRGAGLFDRLGYQREGVPEALNGSERTLDFTNMVEASSDIVTPFLIF